MEMKIDSKLIRAEREKRGWSQEHLANVAGLSLRTIQRIEKAGSASFESATALASVLSVEVAELRASESAPAPNRTIRLSLELPLRLALAAFSGVLVALHFRWSWYAAETPGFGFQWLDMGLAGALFGVTVLCPYLRFGHGLIMRAFALIGSSALSYSCAIMALSSEEWFSLAPGLSSFLFASFIGVTIVLVASRILVPLKVTAAYWFLGMIASLIGGAAMYAGFEFDFGDSPLGTVVSFCVWHMMVCIAIYRGHQTNDAEKGILATFIQTRGRFSIVPGWMKLSLLIRSVYHGRVKAPEDGCGAV
jgi:transcriptional regulator with XRE-family HTH domain